MIGLEATKAFALNLKVSDPECCFGVVKKGYRYRVSTTLTNQSCAGLRWRIRKLTQRSRNALNDTTDFVQCVTPRGRLAAGVSVKLTFELHASAVGRIFLSFQVQGEEDAIRAGPNARAPTDDEAALPRSCAVHVRCSATVLDHRAFRAHVCVARYERRPLLARGVLRIDALPPSRIQLEQGDGAERIVANDRALHDHEAALKKGVLAKLFGETPPPPAEASPERFRGGAASASAAESAADPASDSPEDGAEDGAPPPPPGEDLAESSSFVRNAWLDGVRMPPEAIRLLESQAAEDAADLATMPHFPECVWDPRTRELSIDAEQRRVTVDPGASLEEVIARHDEARAERMGALEAGGLVSGRALAEFARRRHVAIPEGEDAVDEDDASNEFPRRASTMVFLDLAARATGPPATAATAPASRSPQSIHT